jgi:hypothetical protein
MKFKFKNYAEPTSFRNKLIIALISIVVFIAYTIFFKESKVLIEAGLYKFIKYYLFAIMLVCIALPVAYFTYINILIRRDIKNPERVRKTFEKEKKFNFSKWRYKIYVKSIRFTIIGLLILVFMLLVLLIISVNLKISEEMMTNIIVGIFFLLMLGIVVFKMYGGGEVMKDLKNYKIKNLKDHYEDY